VFRRECRGRRAAGLQPDRWLPAEFSRIMTSTADAMGAVTYTGMDGQRIVRPPGLFDTPGAVAGPAMFAALLGLVFAVSAIPVWKRALSLGVAGAGLAAIYLSQVRVSLVATVAMMGGLRLRCVSPGDAPRAPRSSPSWQGGVVVLGLSLAVALADPRSPIASLPCSPPIRSRSTRARAARQLSLTFMELMFQYPIGAGLGRWGMGVGIPSARPTRTARRSGRRSSLPAG